MDRPYPYARIEIHSKTLKWAYVEFNVKLYVLLKRKIDKNTILVANDLDTIFPNWMVSKKNNIPLIYDSHEIFTEMPSVQGRWSQKIWRKLEAYCIPKLSYMMTANESYAQWYANRYDVPSPIVVRNLPKRKEKSPETFSEKPTKIILYQGAINPSRGLDKIIHAMRGIENAELWIAGSGPKLQEYEALCRQLKLQSKIKFLGQISPTELRKTTQQADVGLRIEENNGQSYYFSLPNKISDYVQAGVPVVCSRFPEMIKIVEKYQVGETIQNHTESELQDKIGKVLQNGKKYYEENLTKAAEILCWENEEPQLLNLYQNVVSKEFQ